MFLSRTAEAGHRHRPAADHRDAATRRCTTCARLRKREPQLYDPVHYGAAQALGRQLREAGSWGVLYHSVRHAGGLCAGVFRPRALTSVRETAHIALHWDGARISHWYEKRAPQTLD